MLAAVLNAQRLPGPCVSGGLWLPLLAGTCNASRVAESCRCRAPARPARVPRVSPVPLWARDTP
jgi:hypothetical protein